VPAAHDTLRIALVLPYNPLIERTGLQNLSIRWARGLSSSGFRPIVLTMGPSGVIDGVTIRGHRSFLGLLGTLFTGRWDIVHWLEVWPAGLHMRAQHLASWGLRRWRRIGVVLTTETPGNLERRGGSGTARRIGCRAYSAFVVPSVDFVDEYNRFGIPETLVVVVPHGLLPEEPFRPYSADEVVDLRRGHGLSPDVPVALYIGRLVARKRPLDFIAALEVLADRGVSVQGLIVGDGLRHEDSVDREVQQAVRSTRAAVELRPMSDRPWEYMALSDLVVVPSERDGQAFVVFESMASGAVPIVANVPVLRTTLDTDDDRKCGLLFEAGNTEHLADSIVRLLHDRELHATLRDNGLRWMSRGRNLRRTLTPLTALYERL
jgi:glycosyltransferase involved in cell wall biosynthesis